MAAFVNAADQGGVRMTAQKKLEIAHFTDPLCFWCYAMEPEIRKIRVLLGDQAEYRIVMGVLSSDVREIIGSDEGADLRYEIYRATLANYFREAVNDGSRQHRSLQNAKLRHQLLRHAEIAFCGAWRGSNRSIGRDG